MTRVKIFRSSNTCVYRKEKIGVERLFSESETLLKTGGGT